MKIIKGIFVFISIVCILFTCFFVYSYASGNTGPITMLEAGISKLGGGNKTASTNGSASTVSMLTKQFGLSDSQANKLTSAMKELGVDTSNPAEVSNVIAKNAGNATQIKEIIRAVQEGTMSEAQAKTKLASILNV